MILILWVLGIIIVALLIRALLKKAPSNGKPFLLRIAVVVILLMAIGLALSGLWPVAMSLLGGVMVYGRPVMDKPHARQILEVNDEASHEEIIAAHKRLIAKNHPDKGGSTYLASQINQAKDVLLKD
jgi:hypothetical protein